MLKLLLVFILLLAAVIFTLVMFTRSLRQPQRQSLCRSSRRIVFFLSVSVIVAAVVLTTLSAVLAEVHF